MILQLLFGWNVVCPKKYRNQYSHQGRIVQPRAMHGGLCFRLFLKPVLLISLLDAVAVFVKVITKSCSEGVVLALSVASSTSSKWWSCWDKTLVCRKCLTLAGAGWLSPRYPVKLQTKVCKYFTITEKAPASAFSWLKGCLNLVCNVKLGHQHKGGMVSLL